MEWDWNIVRFELFNALDSINVYDIFLIDRDQNVLTIAFIVQDMSQIRPLLRMRIIDELISKKAVDLYRQYIFLYEVWERPEWDALPAAKFFARGLTKRNL